MMIPRQRIKIVSIPPAKMVHSQVVDLEPEMSLAAGLDALHVFTGGIPDFRASGNSGREWQHLKLPIPENSTLQPSGPSFISGGRLTPSWP